MTEKTGSSDFSYLVGKEETFLAAEAIGKVAVRRFAAVIGDPNPLYRDEKQARQSRYGGLIAPPTLIFELGYDLGDEIEKETGLQQNLVKWLDHPKDINRVSNEYEISQVARPEDMITARRVIKQVNEKQSKAGKWVFINSEVTFHNQKGELLGINRETLACRY